MNVRTDTDQVPTNRGDPLAASIAFYETLKAQLERRLASAPMSRLPVLHEELSIVRYRLLVLNGERANARLM